MTSFFAALAFLTRIPLPAALRIDRSMERVAAAQAWFPVIGLIVGLLLLGVDEAASRALPRPSVDVLLVVALVVITGGLHLDGLSDAADGLLGGGTPERRLEIMRDVHVGAFGVIAIVCVLATKWAGFEALTGEMRAQAIVLTPCVARFGALTPGLAFQPARRDGLGAALGRRPPFGTVIALGVAFCAAVAMFSFSGAYVIGCALIVALAIGLMAHRLIGGMTGDVYGAIIEVTEALSLVLIGALANRGWMLEGILA